MINCDKIISDRNCNIVIQEEFDKKFVYVYILQHTTADGTISNQVIIRDKKSEQAVFSTTSDGFYTLVTIVVPVDESKYFYYKNGKFYKNITEVSIQEILETNTEVSEIDIIYDYYFQTCRLRKCYIKACEELFGGEKCSKNVDSETKYKRDFIWAALNVIEYLAEFEQYEEAQRLLEELTSCYGFCQQEESNNRCCSCRT